MVTPRGRNRKPRTSRMDAAIDAMTPLGFTSAIVRKKVNHLLSVYGGEESWKFIEEDAYKVLIESFLDDQDETKSVTCIEVKKDDPSIEGGEIVACSLEGKETPQELLGGVVPLRKSIGQPSSCYNHNDDSDDDDEYEHFEPAIKASDIEFPKTGEGNRSSIYVGGIRRPFPLHHHGEGTPVHGSSITDVSCSRQGRRRPLRSSNSTNGSERVSNNNQGERKPQLHGNNSRPKRQLVRLENYPYSSHR